MLGKLFLLANIITYRKLLLLSFVLLFWLQFGTSTNLDLSLFFVIKSTLCIFVDTCSHVLTNISRIRLIRITFASLTVQYFIMKPLHYLFFTSEITSQQQYCIEILTAPDRARAVKLILKQRASPTVNRQASQSATADKQAIQSAFAILSSTTSNIKSTWNKMRMGNCPRSTHYLFRTSL